MRRFPRRSVLLILALALPQPGMSQQQLPPDRTTIFTPAQFPLFSFDDLITLSRQQPLSPALESHLTTVLHSVVVDNSLSPSSSSHVRLKDHRPALRIAEWNIERGENFDWVVRAIAQEPAFRKSLLKDNPALKRKQLDAATAQASVLQKTEVILLNEVDLGMGRSQYHHVADELARALRMNYAYGIEFVEVDPLKLGTETITDEDVAHDQQLKQQVDLRLASDPARYKGFHGSAILSRYPLHNVRIERLPVCHDWFNQEYENVATLEQGKRFASASIFLEKIEREVRRGGRMALLADIDLDGSTTQTLTIVDTHLEDKTTPACRRKQMQVLLESVQAVPNPLVLAGDMNTTSADGSLLSLGYVAKSKIADYRFWGHEAITWGTPLPSLFPIKYYKKYSDPTTHDLKFFFYNKEAALFSDVQKFRFSDGGSFDFRGNRSRTVNHTRKRLANSNQRARKGFVYTFSLSREHKGLVGRGKLDWFFIKPVLCRGKTNRSPGPMVPPNPRHPQLLPHRANLRPLPNHGRPPSRMKSIDVLRIDHTLSRIQSL